MKKHFEYRRLAKCYKYKINFDCWEDYTESDTPGMYLFTSSVCPYTMEGTGTNRRCNGKNEHGLPCFYATDRPEKLVPESQVPQQ